MFPFANNVIKYNNIDGKGWNVVEIKILHICVHSTTSVMFHGLEFAHKLTLVL